MPEPRVEAVSRDGTHRFSKVPTTSITLVAGIGVLGDAHAGTLLDLGGPVVRLTGLRNPCAQINDFRPGLLKVVLSRADGSPTDEPAPSTASPEIATVTVIRKAGVMAVVEHGGEVVPGAPVGVTLPGPPHVPLAPV